MKTTDYNIFRTISGNRDINQHHVQQLMDAIENKNLLRYFPVLVNENMEVIDGQHRLAAAVGLGLEVPYEVVSGLQIEDVMSINTNSKSWNIYDFVEAYVQMDNPDYIELKQFIKKYGVSANIGAVLLHGGESGGSGSSQIKSGVFKVNRSAHAATVAELATALSKFANFNLLKSRNFMSALARIMDVEGFDAERLINKISVNASTISRRPSIKYFLLELEELYNINVRTNANFFELYKAAQKKKRA